VNSRNIERIKRALDDLDSAASDVKWAIDDLEDDIDDRIDRERPGVTLSELDCRWPGPALAAEIGLKVIEAVRDNPGGFWVEVTR